MDDIAGIGKVAERLFDVIERGVGALYAPTGVRRMAQAARDAAVEEAKGKALAKLAEAEILTKPENALLLRTLARLQRQEIEAQANLESIAAHAVNELPTTVIGGERAPADKRVSDDWRMRFFRDAQDVCDEDMQLLWGKVLAGEVTKPGSFSLRTLDVLRNLSHEEAVAFQQLCRVSFDGVSPVLRVYRDGTGRIGEKFAGAGPAPMQVLSLRAAGLLRYDVVVVRLDPDGESLNLTRGGVPVLTLKRPTLSGTAALISDVSELHGEFMTPAGEELMQVAGIDLDQRYVAALAQELRVRGYFVNGSTSGDGKLPSAAP